MSWEFANEKDMYAQLVGDFYGPAPESIKQEISNSRQQIAYLIMDYLELKSTYSVLDLGSGTGDMAQVVACKVSHLYCADISSSFLAKAKENCKAQKNISYHHLSSFKFDFLKDNSLDAIYSHAVFIHLNIFDIVLYFQNFNRIIKDGGKVYIDFITSDFPDFMDSPNLKQHVEHYEQNKKSLPMLLSFHSKESIVKVASYFGFHLLRTLIGPNHTVGMLLQKGVKPDNGKNFTLKLKSFISSIFSKI